MTGIITTYAGVGGTGGYNGITGSATTTMLLHPAALALDAAGNLYIADSGNNLIRRVDTTGNMTTVAGYYYRDGSLPPAQQIALNTPMGVVVDHSGNVYFSDTGDGVVYKLTPGGSVSIYAGTANSSAGPNDGGQATAALLNNPQALTLDLAGDLFIADNGHNSIRKVDQFGIITTIAGMTGASGSNYYFFDPMGAPATQMTLVAPGGVAVGMRHALSLRRA